MSAPVLCFVRIPRSQQEVDRIEAANPDVVQAIVAAASKYMTRHRRAASDVEVVETEEFASQEDFDAFMAEAAPAVERYDALLGAPTEVTLYRIIGDDDESWRDPTAAG